MDVEYGLKGFGDGVGVGVGVGVKRKVFDVVVVKRTMLNPKERALSLKVGKSTECIWMGYYCLSVSQDEGTG